jgi:hypothetical protein
MDQRKFMLLEALKTAALSGGELRLYRRGKLPGLFPHRTRLHAEIAGEALQAGFLEVARVEAVGKTAVEWVRVTPKGLDYLLQSESPARALDELRAVLAFNQQNMPAWLADMHRRLDELAQRFAAEIEQVRQRLDQVAERAIEAMDRIAPAAAAPVPWAQEALAVLERRRQVGLGKRCALADLYAALKERQHDLTIREFHQGLKRLHERQLVELRADVPNGDAPGPEYALLDGPAVYYYVEQTPR